MKAVLKAIQEGLKAEPVLLIANSKEAEAVKIATEQGLDTYYLSSKTHGSEAELDQAICETLQRADIDLVLLSGYMKKLGLKTLTAFRGRILNMHPALLPSYGGKGMYGDRVHQTVLDNKEIKSGASVHIVTAEYDQGPVLNQKEVAVVAGETLDSLREKVKSLEGDIYVETLEKIIQGQIDLADYC